MQPEPQPVTPRVDPAAADMATMVGLGLVDPPEHPGPVPPGQPPPDGQPTAPR